MRKRCFMLLVAILSSWGYAPMARAESTIPFVGCPATSMQTGITTPGSTGAPLKVEFPPDIASKLALYVGEQFALIAPRGWDCSAGGSITSGSLQVYPKNTGQQTDTPIVSIQAVGGDDTQAAADILSTGRKFFPKIVSDRDVISFLTKTPWSGETEQQFLSHSDFYKLYTVDHLKYLSNSLVEFETPAGKIGIGDELLASSPVPTPSIFTSYGFIGIVFGPDFPAAGSAVYLMAARLPPSMDGLRHAIIMYDENCFENHESPCAGKEIYGSDYSQ